MPRPHGDGVVEGKTASCSRVILRWRRTRSAQILVGLRMQCRAHAACRSRTELARRLRATQSTFADSACDDQVLSAGPDHPDTQIYRRSAILTAIAPLTRESSHGSSPQPAVERRLAVQWQPPCLAYARTKQPRWNSSMSRVVIMRVPAQPTVERIRED